MLRNTQASPTTKRYVVLAGLCVAATLAYICRSSLAVPEKTIVAELELRDEQIGNVMTAFFLTYAIFQIPAAWLGQVIGSRRALALFALGWSVATMGFGVANGLWLLLIMNGAMGIAQAGLFSCSVNTVREWLPATRRAIACGSLGSFMGIGGAVAMALTAFLLEYLTWRQVFLLLPLPGLVWAVWFFVWFRDRPRNHAGVNAGELEIIAGAGDGEVQDEKPTTGTADRTPWLAMVTSVSLWMICSQQFFRAAGAVFYLTWFPRYLQEVHGLSQEDAGYLSSLPLLAQVLGSLAGGALVDAVLRRTGSLRLSRQGIAIVSLSVCALCFLAVYFLNAEAIVTIVLITAGHLVGTLGGPCAYAVTIDIGGRNVPTVFGSMNMCGNLGAAACPTALISVVGVIGWESVPIVFAVIYALAASCWFLVNPHSRIVRRTKA